MGNFNVRFEKWSFEKHVVPKVIPSYGGWVTFKGIPLSAWKTDTFTHWKCLWGLLGCV